jgi:hypothetical protein
MRVVLKLVLLVSVVSLLAASPALAKTKEQSARISIAFAATMADGTQLQPGSYKVTLLNETGSPHIVFYKNGKLVCKCPVKLEDTGTKIPVTLISYDQNADKTQRITTIEIGGWTQRVILSGSGS